jgi:hypothetical protein
MDTSEAAQAAEGDKVAAMLFRVPSIESISLSDDDDEVSSKFSAAPLFRKLKEAFKTAISDKKVSQLPAGPGARRLQASNRNMLWFIVTTSIFIIFSTSFGIYFARFVSFSGQQAVTSILFICAAFGGVFLAIILARGKRGYVNLDDFSGDIEIYQPSGCVGICGGSVSIFHYRDLKRDPFIDVLSRHDATTNWYNITFPCKEESVYFYLLPCSQTYHEFDLVGPPDSVKAELGIILDWLRSMERK